MDWFRGGATDGSRMRNYFALVGKYAIGSLVVAHLGQWCILGGCSAVHYLLVGATTRAHGRSSRYTSWTRTCTNKLASYYFVDCLRISCRSDADTRDVGNE